MKQEKIFIKSRNGNKLACLISKPDTKAEGLVVSSQGFGSTKDKEQYQFLLNELPKLNFIIIVFEYQGLGESEGEFRDKTATRDLEDLRAVVDYAYDSFNFNKEKFFIFGSSFGGFTALNLVLEDNRIKGLVLKCPVSDFGKLCEHLIESKKYPLGHDAFIEDGKNRDFYKEASKINIPVRIIHGDKDISVFIKQSEKLVSLIPDTKLSVIEGAGHEFEGQKEKVNSKIIEFFSELK